MIASRSIGSLSAIIFLLTVCGCSSHGSAGSTGSATATPSPAAPATPYLGIERIDKAYVPALKKNVLVVTLGQMPRGGDPNGLASNVFDGVKGSLQQSNFDLAVIKMPMTSTSNSSSSAIVVYVRDPSGKWARTQDPAVIEAIDRAGL
ncbi:MAG TPA: hypothetical protein VFO25_03620 [Candidatus Eremiobacteraceae bacterium]|nr:hypothetical protein [Candidatus Eremiobacteraceae bacterium]